MSVKIAYFQASHRR